MTVKQSKQETDNIPTAKNASTMLPLPPILEVARSNNTAPPKRGLNAQSSQAAGQDDDPNPGETRLLLLETHEELLFHYLSILALLPQRRSDILQILDTYGQRDQREKDATTTTTTTKGGTGSQFDLVS